MGEHLFPLLGLPLAVESNDPAALEAAEESFGSWRRLPAELVAPAPRLNVSVVVSPGAGAAGERFNWRHNNGWFIASAGPHVLSARVDLGEAVAFVTRQLVAERANLRYQVLECLGLLLASFHDRTPIQAAAVVRGERAIVLAGPSGTGKSSLCYACVRAGFQLLAEDVVYVSSTDGLGLWGCPWHMHLLPDTVRFFPELADRPVELQANGKEKLEVVTTHLHPEAAQPHATRAVVCLVERVPGVRSTLEPIDPALAIATLSQNLEPGFDLLADRTSAAAAALAGGGAFRLRMGYDPRTAVALLEGI